jgi:hypothetical protein
MKESGMEQTRQSSTRWATYLVALAAGGLVAGTAHGLGDGTCGLHWARQAYDAIGIVIVGLIPLSVWGGRLIWRQLTERTTNRRMELDYGYIARTSTLLGLLGTIISLSIATVQLGQEVSTGSNAAILKVIPMTGQALMSTFVGLVIALAAETALHLIERKQQES